MTSSIKGIAIGVLVKDTVELLASGKVSAEDASGLLTEDDRKLLAEPVVDSAWYDIRSYRRLTELLREYEGQGDPLYVKRRGVAVAERLIGLGMYQQVDVVRRVGQDVDAAVSNLKLTATLWNSFFNFGGWEVFTEDEGNGIYGMTVKDSHDMPEVGWQAIHGFMQRLAQEAAQSGVRVTVARRQSPEGEVMFVFGLDQD